MLIFLGKSTHSLDEKWRLILPKRFMDEFAPKEKDTLHLTAAPEGCLLLLESQAWEQVRTRFATDLFASPALRAESRLYLGHAEKVQPDGSNRITIPEALRDYARIQEKSEVVLAGNGIAIEIWAKSRWDAALQLGTPSDDSFSHNNLIGSATAQQS